MRLNARKDELERQISEETPGFRNHTEAFNEEKFRYTL